MGSTLPLLLLLAAMPPGPETVDDPCSFTDEEGRVMQTCFDPGNGFELGIGGVQRGRFSAEVSAAVLVRSERDSRSREQTRWYNEHRILVSRLEIGRQTAVVSLYQGSFRRHLRDGYVLIPTTPAFRLPFPFDVAISVSALRWERRPDEGPGGVIETGRAALLLDPVKSQSGKSRLSFGPSLSHTLVLDGATVGQEISPLTSLAVDLGTEDDEGFWSVRLQGYAGYSFYPGQAAVFRARGELQADLVFAAINDQPVALRLFGGARRRDAGVARQDEWSAGLRLVVKAFGD